MENVKYITAYMECIKLTVIYYLNKLLNETFDCSGSEIEGIERAFRINHRPKYKWANQDRSTIEGSESTGLFGFASEVCRAVSYYVLSNVIIHCISVSWAMPD